MKTTLSTCSKPFQDRIEGNSIILDSRGDFPKRLIILTKDGVRVKEYRIVRTRNGGYILNS